MRAYDVGPGKFYSEAQLARFGTPQGSTELVIMKPFSRPIIEAGTCQQRRESPRAISEHEPSQEEPHPSQTDKESEKFSCPGEGCIKMFQSFAALQRYLDVGKHMLKLAKESAYDEIKRKWIEVCHSVGGDYVRSQTSAKDSDDQSSVLQLELGWALRRTRKSIAFSEKAKKYLVDVFWTAEETGKKANASEVASRMKPLRDDMGQEMFAKTDWLTEQQIARYFSRLAALNKSGHLQSTRAVSLNEDEETEDDDLAAETETIRTRQQDKERPRAFD